MFPSRAPNPFLDDDVKQERRTNIQLPTSSRRAVVIVAVGCAALLGFAAMVLIGLPGAGIGLVPFGLLMILLGGIELLLSRLG